jgi:hypothetical protein
VRDAGLEKIGCNHDRPARPGRVNFVRQRIQSFFSSRNQRQFVAVMRKDPRQCQTDTRRRARDDRDWTKFTHRRC